jgi:hypothetical protein
MKPPSPLNPPRGHFEFRGQGIENHLEKPPAPYPLSIEGVGGKGARGFDDAGNARLLTYPHKPFRV